MSEAMNVKLTIHTLRETEWHRAVNRKPKRRNGMIIDNKFTEVWVSKQLPFVLLARMETGEYFVYDHLRYNKNIPVHMEAFFDKWNHDNGFETMQ